MLAKELIPRVEHRDEARSGSEVSSADLDHGRCCGIEEEAIGKPGVPAEQGIQAVRDREDVVEVGNRQQIPDLRLDPQRLVQALALRAVAVAARVVEGTLAAAPSHRRRCPPSAAVRQAVSAETTRA